MMLGNWVGHLVSEYIRIKEGSAWLGHGVTDQLLPVGHILSSLPKVGDVWKGTGRNRFKFSICLIYFQRNANTYKKPTSILCNSNKLWSKKLGWFSKRQKSSWRTTFQNSSKLSSTHTALPAPTYLSILLLVDYTSTQVLIGCSSSS